MTWQFPAAVPALLVAAAVAAATVASLRRRDNGPAGVALVGILVAAGGWSLLAGLGHARADLAGSLVAVKVGYPFAAILPVAWLVFAWRFTARGDRLNRRLIVALSIVPVITVLTVWLFPGVSLFWRDVGSRSVNGATYLDPTHGPAFVLHIAYSYALLAVGSVAIGRRAIQATDSHRLRGSVVLLAVLAPWAGNAAFLLGALPGGVDPTPIATVVSGVLLASAVVRYDLLDVPLAARAFARDTAVEEAVDGLIVLTDDGVVTDCNPAAAAALDLDRDAAIGRPLADAAPDLADAIDGFDPDDGPSPAGRDTIDRITRTADGGKRHYEVSVSPFSRRGLDGTIVTLREVTDAHRRRRRVGVLNRILRHDLRNEMNVVLGYAELLEDEVSRRPESGSRAPDHTGDLLEPAPPSAPDGGDGPVGSGGDGAENWSEGTGPARAVTRISESADAMLELSDSVREIKATLDAQGDEVTRLDVAALVRTQVDGLERQTPGARFSVEGPETAWVAAAELIDAVFENLLENAIEHSHREHPTVTVSIAAGPETVAVTVADDGPGIPQQELATFRADVETPLTHSSGLGLWLVIWIVEESGGDVTFDVDETGTAVTVRLPAADPPT